MNVDVSTLAAPLESEWNELCDSTGQTPFVRPGWFRAWLTAFGGSDDLIVATGREGGALVGVLPLLGSRRRWQSPTNWHTPEFAAVGASADVERELVSAVAERAPSELRLAFVGTDRPTAAAMRDSAGRRPFERVLLRAPFVTVSTSWEEYEAGLSRDVVKTLRRRRRRLEEEGEVTIDAADGTTGLDAALAEGFAVEASGWKGQGGTAIASRDETRSFYSEVARWASAAGMLRLAFLRLDGRPIAFHFDLVDNGVAFGLKGAYDHDYGRFAPSRLLRHAMVKQTFETGGTRYEFLGADEQYKRDWANGHRELMVLQSFDRSLSGRLTHVLQAHGLPLARAARSHVPGLALPGRSVVR